MRASVIAKVALLAFWIDRPTALLRTEKIDIDGSDGD